MTRNVPALATALSDRSNVVSPVRAADTRQYKAARTLAARVYKAALPLRRPAECLENPVNRVTDDSLPSPFAA